MESATELPEEFNRQLRELSQLLLGEGTVEVAMRRIVDLAVAAVPRCDSCSVSLNTGGEIATAVASDDLAGRLDAYQYGKGSGPCLDALLTGEAFRVDSGASEPRWSGFMVEAAREGLQGVYSLPLRLDSRVVGALNLYSRSGPFGESDESTSQALAHQAAITLANAQAYEQTQELIRNLRVALESRDIIGQAKGIIMERERCTADRAFDILRSVSQARNIKLRDVAQRVVDTGTWAETEV